MITYTPIGYTTVQHSIQQQQQKRERETEKDNPHRQGKKVRQKYPAPAKNNSAATMHYHVNRLNILQIFGGPSAITD